MPTEGVLEEGRRFVRSRMEPYLSTGTVPHATSLKGIGLYDPEEFIAFYRELGDAFSERGDAERALVARRIALGITRDLDYVISKKINDSQTSTPEQTKAVDA